MKKLLFALILFAACTVQKKDLSKQPIIFVGTYTQKLGHVDGKATGIYTCRLDEMTGEMTVIDSTTDIPNPTFLSISPDKKYLYSVGELSGNGLERLGRVAAYKITERGKL